MFVETVEALEAIYSDTPPPASMVKELDHAYDDAWPERAAATLG